MLCRKCQKDKKHKAQGLCSTCYDTKRKRIRRRNNKLKAIGYLGGGCRVCGYSECVAALEFHHLDPSEKEDEPNILLRGTWEKLKKELDKCILLCSNHHREIHYEEMEEED